MPSLGVDGAGVTIIEFSDYQCPFCRVLEPRLQQLVSRHPNEVSVYRYDLPLEEIHPYARTASIAADCAALQGVTEDYQVQLFNRQDNLADIDWVDLAKRTGVRDLVVFTKCLDAKISSDRIDQDLETGKRLKIVQTPALIINGSLVEGAIRSEELERLFARAKRNVH